MTLLPLSRPGRAESVPQSVDGPRRDSTGAHWLFKAYARSGLLVIMSVICMIGGLLVQSVRPELPLGYTWLQPLETLKHVALSAHFPLLAMLAYLCGAFSRKGLAGLKGWLLSFHGAAMDRTASLLRGLAFLGAFGSDVLFVPAHGPLDALALGAAAALIARPWPKRALARVALHAALAALVLLCVCYWFTAVKALTFVGSRPKDALIITFETSLFGVTPHRWVAAWAAQSSGWLYWLDRAYFRIFEHMALTTAVLLGVGNVRARTEYLGALAICYFLGAPLYLTFPAAGPVYFDPGAFRFLQQQELLVNQVQPALLRNTGLINEGRATILQTWAYIACMPSLHMAHEFVMLYFSRFSKLVLVVSLGFTALTSVAVLALGWHYPSDLVAGAALAVFAITVARWQSSRLLPRDLVT